MAVILPAGKIDTTIAMYDVSGECRTVVKVRGVHIVEAADGSWSIFVRGDRRDFPLLGQAIVAAEALAGSIEV